MKSNKTNLIQLGVVQVVEDSGFSILKSVDVEMVKENIIV